MLTLKCLDLVLFLQEVLIPLTTPSSDHHFFFPASEPPTSHLRKINGKSYGVLDWVPWKQVLSPSIACRFVGDRSGKTPR